MIVLLLSLSGCQSVAKSVSQQKTDGISSSQDALQQQDIPDSSKLINNHQEIFVPSPVMNIGNPGVSLVEGLKEDYTQYIPRGHYAKSDDLKSYFQAMMWYGRLTFRAAKEDETKSAALITLLLSRQQEYDHWNRIYEPTNFFVGKSDDLGFSQYFELLKESYGEIPTLDALTGNTGKWSTFLAGLEKLESPAINSIPIFDESIQPDRTKEIKGFRLMGQRFTLDAPVFQHLIYREVQENSSGERRMLPKGLDIPAALGSKEAYSLLDAMGETRYEKYPENMKKIQAYIDKLDAATWTQNLYWSWLYTLKPLIEPKGAGYPTFMGNQAWTRKQLETYLGSWTELKHDIWRSPRAWSIDSFALGDVNNDGTVNLVVTLWKAGSFGTVKPFWQTGEDVAYKNHLFVYQLKDKEMKQVWCSSNLDRPILSFKIHDVDGDGMNELVIEERQYRKMMGDRYTPVMLF